MLVKAKEKIYYGGRERIVGEQFEMDDRASTDISILKVLGKIEVVEKVVTPDPPREEPFVPRVPRVEAAVAKSEGGAEKKRYYRRRDMRPEE